MNEHSILFSGPMVRAIMDGRKTQTRRIIKPQPVKSCNVDGETACELVAKGSPYGRPGDRLWVRETWASFGSSRSITPPVPLSCQIRYDADNTCQWRDVPDGARGVHHDASFRKRPSIYMPRWASRLTLEITAVRLERLQDITEADARAEGIIAQAYGYGVEGLHMSLQTAREAFGCLWDGINAERGYPWADNPWVWVVEFQKVEMKGR